MTRTIRAEWTRLTRPRMLMPALGVGVFVAVLLTAVLFLTAGERPNAFGLSTGVLAGAAGATLPVTTGMAFASLLVFAMFVSMSAGGFARGTWRTSLLHEPRSWTLATGTFLARWGVVALVSAAVMVVGWVTAAALALWQGLDTSAWLTLDGLQAVGEDYLRVVAFCGGWGLLGTLLGTLTRSIPVGLGLGLLWAGPLENILGDELDIGNDVFPGLLLRAVVAPEAGTLGATQLTVTLLGYAAVCLVVIGLVLRRRDVTT